MSFRGEVSLLGALVASVLSALVGGLTYMWQQRDISQEPSHINTFSSCYFQNYLFLFSVSILIPASWAPAPLYCFDSILYFCPLGIHLESFGCFLFLLTATYPSVLTHCLSAVHQLCVENTHIIRRREERNCNRHTIITWAGLGSKHIQVQFGVTSTFTSVFIWWHHVLGLRGNLFFLLHYIYFTVKVIANSSGFTLYILH